MIRNASTRHFTLRTHILLPVALTASTVALAGPAHAAPDPGTPASTTTAAAETGVRSTSDCPTAVQDIARLRANLTALHGSDYRATVGCDGTHGITVQRGRFAGHVTEYG